MEDVDEFIHFQPNPFDEPRLSMEDLAWLIPLVASDRVTLDPTNQRVLINQRKAEMYCTRLATMGEGSMVGKT